MVFMYMCLQSAFDVIARLKNDTWFELAEIKIEWLKWMVK